MHIDRKKLDPFVRLRDENTPCPRCQSERVTVRSEGAQLRAVCSDCGYTKEAPSDAGR